MDEEPYFTNFLVRLELNFEKLICLFFLKVSVVVRSGTFFSPFGPLTRTQSVALKLFLRGTP